MLIFLPAYFTINILGKHRYISRDEKFSGFNVDYEFKDIVFVPYCNNDHFLLIVLHLKKKTITKYDPFHRGYMSDDAEIYLLLEWMKKCKNFYRLSKNNLVDIDQKIATSSLNRPLQRDSYNCGVFILFCMKRIATETL